jgi:hypothetical protein
VCGIVVDLINEPVPNAKVQILKGTTEVLSVKTGGDGKFSFGHLDAGDYQVRVEAAGFRTVPPFRIIVVKPKATGKRMLQIRLTLGDGCSYIRSIKSK